MENSNLAASSLLELTQKDRKGLWIFGESESKRRVILIEKKNGSYGFTLQSYGVRYKHGNRETDFITYVNAVEKEGAAYAAGLREGDVILSINGQSMAHVEHKSLVSFIRKCPTHLKMVVVSDERARKVELHMRYVHLQKKLHDKMKELEQLNWKESEVLSGTYRNPCGSPMGGPCLAAASSVCCFCPSSKSSSTKPNSTVLDDKEKSKSMGATDKHKKERDSAYYYDCYRKSQSSRELHHQRESNSQGPSAATSSSKLKSHHSSGSMEGSSATGPLSHIHASGGVSLNSSKTAVSSSHHSYTHPHTHTHTSSVESQKPKSWDNLITTKSFGGYGFGFGYGYFPSKPVSGQGTYGHHGHVTHPHHHNHCHGHCSHSHSTSNYYYNKNSHSQQPSSSRGTPAVTAVVEPSSSAATTSSHFMEHRICGGSAYNSYQVSSSSQRGNRSNTVIIDSTTTSKTLPSMKGKNKAAASRVIQDSFTTTVCKLEKTLSDSSLNSEHHKDFPKSMSYFKHSSENVRYSSDDEYDQYGNESSMAAKHDIFV